MRSTGTKSVALGGVLAALAVVIMCIGSLIPVATYVCPMLCTLLLQVVLWNCGKRISWAWYGAVAVLGLLFAPDKEAAAVFLFLGYYPILKPWLDKRRLSPLWKLALFNSSLALLYFLLIHLFSMADIAEEFQELGVAMGAVMALLGNVTFFILDKLLTRLEKKK